MESGNEVGVAAGKRRGWLFKIIIIVAVLVLVVLVAYRGYTKYKNKEVATDGEKLLPVGVAMVVSQPFSEEVSIAGTIFPYREANLSPKVSGRVISINAGVGDKVSQGQTLFVIDQSDYSIALKQAEANLAAARANSIQVNTAYENAKLNYDRTEELYKQGILPESQLEAARGQLAAAESGYKANQAQILQCEAMLEKAKSDYANTEVTAPFFGVVFQRRIEVGEMVSPQVAAYTIIQDEPLLVRVSLPENLVIGVSPGQNVDVYVSSTNKTYSGTVSSIAPQADSATKAFTAEIKLSGVGQELKPGMVADLRLKVKQLDSALLVPTNALLDEDTGKSVFVVENGVAVQRKVVTGIEGKGLTQVVEGLKQGDSVVVEGNHLLVDGMGVQVKETVEQPAPAGGGSN
ncbi:MAG: efflux RND transporter periplasmic adaptor subunit [Bacillota bacterium]